MLKNIYFAGIQFNSQLTSSTRTHYRHASVGCDASDFEVPIRLPAPQVASTPVKPPPQKRPRKQTTVVVVEEADPGCDTTEADEAEVSLYNPALETTPREDER